MAAKDSSSRPTARSIADGYFTPGRFLALLIAIVIVRFPTVLLGRDTLFHRDYGLFTYPIAHYYRECFWHGQMPLWNPYNYCGIPLLAQWNTSFLYPPSLFYLLLPLTLSLAVFNLAHLVFAGMGMYFLARRWTGSQLAAFAAGMAFAFNGLSLHMLMWISNLAAWAWMPWVVLSVERAWRERGRQISLAILACAMQMLSGAPELIVLTWGCIAALWFAQFFRREIPRGRLLWRTILIGLLTAGLAAAQLLPFLQLLAHSQRDANYSDSKWAMPGWGWANFIVPLFHCTPSIIGIYSQDAQQWTSSYYLGIGVLAMALIALWQVRDRKVLWLAVAVIVGVILSMGANAYVYDWIKRIFPPMGVMRYPIKIVVLTSFTMPLLAAYALKSTTSPASERKSPYWIVGLLLTVTALGIVFCARSNPVINEKWMVTFVSGLSRLIFLALILFAVWLVNRAQTIRTIGFAGVAIVLLIALDAFTHAPDQNPVLPAAIYQPIGMDQVVHARLGDSRALLDPRLAGFLSHAGTPDPVQVYLGLRKALFMNCNLLDDIPTASGFSSLELGTSAQVMGLLNNENFPPPAPLEDFAGISQISAPDTSFTWITRTNAMPLITSGQKLVFATRDEILQNIAGPNFNPRTTVYLPDTARDFISITNQSPAQINRGKFLALFQAQRVEFITDAAAPAMVVIAQANYAPWHAYVDGVRTRLFEANGAFQAVQVPAGHHSVKLIYEDSLFTYGCIISIISLLVVMIIGFVGFKR